MTKRFLIALLLFAAITAAGSIGFAQEQKVTVSRPPVATVMVDVTLSRHLGEKVLSSTPYTLAVTPGERASLRMGGDVPVPSTTFTPAPKDEANAKPATATPITSYGYRTIGTSIDVTCSNVQDGQYRLTVTVEESSIYPADVAPPTAKATGAPAFRSFKSTSPVSMRDGQKLEYTLATDRLTGEVYRISIKMTLEK